MRLDPHHAAAHADRLFRQAMLLTGNRQDAEDLVQETFEVVLRRPRRVLPGNELAYLLAALRNRHLDRRREASRRPACVAIDDWAAFSGLEGQRPHERAEQREVLDAVAALPDHHREVLDAVDVAGLSYAEAARALRVPRGTVMSRLFRARQGVVERVERGAGRPAPASRAPVAPAGAPRRLARPAAGATAAC
jgi:RNA polymerase sigma-70 factor (ECF subfamily)